MKFYNKKMEEVETIINFDNFNKEVTVYTTRTATIKRLKNLLGEPVKIDAINGRIYSCEWHIKFLDRKKIRKILSITFYITKL